MAVDPMIRELEEEIRVLRKALQRYANCRHGEQSCNCTVEARVALYPYLTRDARTQSAGGED